MGLIDSIMGTEADPAPKVYKLTGLDGKPLELTEEQMANMDHATLLNLRERNQNDKALQAVMGPYEHRAFARQATADNPLMSVPLAVATPLYTAAKSVGLMTDDNTTKPSLREVGQGLLGIGEGLGRAFKNATS